MSTLENKFEFKDDLIASFTFQNTMQAQSSETQEMHVPIVNNNGDGYDLVTKTPYSSNPEFDFNLILNAISTTLFKYVNDKFIFNKNVEVPTPVNDSDATTKVYVDTAIGGVVVPSTIVLQGDVIGSGVTGTPFTTTLTKLLIKFLTLAILISPRIKF